MGDVLYIVYSALAVILLAASCGPHFRAGNVGAIALVGWCMVFAMISFINHIVYFTSYENLTPIWCDIGESGRSVDNGTYTELTNRPLAVVKIQSTVQTGLAAASLCINRRLALISSSKRVNGDVSKRLALSIDITIVAVPSAAVMLVSYFVQAHRYNVKEGFGCVPATYWEKEAVVGLLGPPLLLGTVSFGYGCKFGVDTQRSTLRCPADLRLLQCWQSTTSPRNAGDSNRSCDRAPQASPPAASSVSLLCLASTCFSPFLASFTASSSSQRTSFPRRGGRTSTTTSAKSSFTHKRTSSTPALRRWKSQHPSAAGCLCLPLSFTLPVLACTTVRWTGISWPIALLPNLSQIHKGAVFLSLLTNHCSD